MHRGFWVKVFGGCTLNPAGGATSRFGEDCPPRIPYGVQPYEPYTVRLTSLIPPRPTTSPAVLPDGTLTPKQDFEAHLYVHPCLASRPHSFNRRLYNSDAFAGKRS